MIFYPFTSSQSGEKNHNQIQFKKVSFSSFALFLLLLLLSFHNIIPCSCPYPSLLSSSQPQPQPQPLPIKTSPLSSRRISRIKDYKFLHKDLLIYILLNLFHENTYLPSVKKKIENLIPARWKKKRRFMKTFKRGHFRSIFSVGEGGERWWMD